MIRRQVLGNPGRILPAERKQAWREDQSCETKPIREEDKARACPREGGEWPRRIRVSCAKQSQLANDSQKKGLEYPPEMQ
jgi:hypothetical protein